MQTSISQKFDNFPIEIFFRCKQIQSRSKIYSIRNTLNNLLLVFT
jgi:hypothetical protein